MSVPIRERGSRSIAPSRIGIRSVHDGFTLVELLVAMLVISILIAIAVPTYFGARKRASNRAAQTSLRLALTAEMAYYNSGTAEFTSDPSLLNAEELGLYWIGPAPSTHFKEVSVDHYRGDFVCLAVKSPAGDSFGMLAEMLTPSNVWYGNDTPVQASDFCSSHSLGAVPSPGNWSTDPAVGWSS